MNDFLKSKRLYMLFILPFIIMAISFYSNYFAIESLPSLDAHGVINIAYINNLDKTWVMIIGFIVVLLLAYMIFFVNEKYKLLSQTTTLPSLIYVLLTSGIMFNLGFNYLLISIFILSIAIGRLQGAIDNTKSNASIFDFGCFITLSVAIYPKFIFLVLWAICVLFFSGRSTIKDIIALLLGFFTVSLFIAFYYFWTDRLESLPVVFMDNLLLGEHIRTLPMIEYIRLGILLFLLLIALYNILSSYSVSVVNQRRGILSIVSLFIFLSLTFFVIPGNYYDFMYALALPLSFILGQYFISNRLVVFGNLMFLLFLGACFLTYFV